MKRNIIILLCITLLTIVGLQLHFNISSYRTEEEIFERKVNEGLKLSVNTSFEQKRAAVINELEAYMNDESKVRISCQWSAKNEMTIFTIADVDTSKHGQHKASFSKGDIPERIDSITPEVKKRFIDIFLRDVENELKKGTVWYTRFCTFNIGDFLHQRYFKTSIDLAEIRKIYRAHLNENFIYEEFEFNPGVKTAHLISTQKIDMSLYRGVEPLYVQAFFKSPYSYIIRKQAGALIGSLLLILISLFSFGYMLKVLLSQQKLNEQKDQLVTNITHELKTPLTTIQITAEAIKAFDLTPEERQNYLDIILKNTESLDKLTTGILTEARVGQLKPQIQPVAVSALIDTIRINTDQIEVVNEADNGLSLTTDPELLIKILQNLIDNSAKYNTSDLKKVVISAIESRRNVQIVVSDNGIGIPDADKDKVFERFYRVPTKDIHDIRGYGIGLSYVKQVMKILNGRIELKDNFPQGSVFTLTFPQ